MFQITPVVKNLLLINIIVFAASLLLDVYDEAVHYFALYYIGSGNFRAWQFVTYMFLHADLGHIFGNMIGLLVFGTWLEQVWGSKRFLQYYLITGVGAAILFMGVEYLELNGMQNAVNTFLQKPTPGAFEVLVGEHFEEYFAHPQVAQLMDAYAAAPESLDLKREASLVAQELYHNSLNVPMLGASGAVFGILLAAGLLFPYRRIMLLIPPIPMRARVLVVLYGAYEIYRLIERAPNDNVAHMAHVGGMLVGFILLYVWGEARNRYQ